MSSTSKTCSAETVQATCTLARSAYTSTTPTKDQQVFNALPYLSCKNIELKVAHRVLVKALSFTLDPAEKKALIGPNGCGKTTLLRTLAGLAIPTQGQVNMTNAKIQFLSCIPSLILDHCVLWNLEFYTQSYGLKINLSEFQNSLAYVGLSGREKQLARSLSTGQKRRLSLASLLLIEPDIILADEPTSGLDEEGTNLCIDIFEKLRHKKNTAVLVATHDAAIITWCQTTIQLDSYSVKNKSAKTLVKDLF